LNLAIHNLLVRLRDNSNQEIKQNNEDENLIEDPFDINAVNHEICSATLEISSSCGNVLKNISCADIIMIEINKVVWISTICSNSRIVCDNRGPEVV